MSNGWCEGKNPDLQEEGSSWTNKRGAYKDSEHDKTSTTAENRKKLQDMQKRHVY